MAGTIIFPACFSYGVAPEQGPSLLFVTLPQVFVNMAGGRVWGTLASGERFDLETGRLDGGKYMSPGTVHTPEGYKLHRERVQRNERVRAAGMDLYRSQFKNNEDFLDELDALIRKYEGERP